MNPQHLWVGLCAVFGLAGGVLLLVSLRQSKERRASEILQEWSDWIAKIRAGNEALKTCEDGRVRRCQPVIEELVNRGATALEFCNFSRARFLLGCCDALLNWTTWLQANYLVDSPNGKFTDALLLSVTMLRNGRIAQGSEELVNLYQLTDNNPSVRVTALDLAVLFLTELGFYEVAQQARLKREEILQG